MTDPNAALRSICREEIAAALLTVMAHCTWSAIEACCIEAAMDELKSKLDALPSTDPAPCPTCEWASRSGGRCEQHNPSPVAQAPADPPDLWIAVHRNGKSVTLSPYFTAQQLSNEMRGFAQMDDYIPTRYVPAQSREVDENKGEPCLLPAPTTTATTPPAGPATRSPGTSGSGDGSQPSRTDPAPDAAEALWKAVADYDDEPRAWSNDPELSCRFAMNRIEKADAMRAASVAILAECERLTNLVADIRADTKNMLDKAHRAGREAAESALGVAVGLLRETLQHTVGWSVHVSTIAFLSDHPEPTRSTEGGPK